MRLIATCPEEVKTLLAEEIRQYGGQDIATGFRCVFFSVTDRELFYHLHLKLSLASHIMLIVKEGFAKDEQMLFSQAKRVNWPSLFSAEQTYKIDGIAGDRGKDKMSSNEISKQVRHAIEHVFAIKGQKTPRVELGQPKVVIKAMIRESRLCLSLVTSGKTMHKRGYRLDTHPAPIKETLAAALLKLMNYDGSQNLYDPMCGSGTIAIEGSMLALNKACLIHRSKNEFGFEHLTMFDRELWRKVQDKVRGQKASKPAQAIFASDKEAHYVDLARTNALRARVEKFIDFRTGSFFDLEAPASSGLLISNLPYGERIDDEEDLKLFYKQIGDTLKQRYKGWTAGILVSEDSPWKHFGLRASKRLKLKNGGIEARFLVFELY